jgi:hypothetical protein
MPNRGVKGTVQADNAGNVFFFGGGGNFREVYKVGSREVIATLPVDVRYSNSVKYNSSNTVYIFGGQDQSNPNTILAFDLERLNYTTIASNLPFYVNGAASVQLGNKAYIFDRKHGLKKAIEFDLETLQMSPVGPQTLPRLDHQLFPSAVRDETHAYLIGGYYPRDGPTNGIYQFDLTTFENRFLPVKNFPVEGNRYFSHAPASVYVKKQNRIYFFSGTAYNQSFNYFNSLNKIFFIDLSPLNVPTTTTPATETTTKTTTEQPETTTMNPAFFNCINRTNGNLYLCKKNMLLLL